MNYFGAKIDKVADVDMNIKRVEMDVKDILASIILFLRLHNSNNKKK